MVDPEFDSPAAEPLEVRLPRRFSRREVLKRAGVASAIGSLPLGLGAKVARAASRAASVSPTGALNTGQLATLQAIAARIVPTDANGPGATEAGVANYINLSLGGWPSLRNSLASTIPGTSVTSALPAYVAGLAATDAYAQSKKGAAFASLAPADQDAVLTDMQSGAAAGSFVGGATTFFNLVRGHVLQGMACDPYYKGNQNFVGWKWIGYPGIRMPVKAADQTLTKPLMNPMSAYDMPTYKAGPPNIKG
jgi:gluconate 2-dehydrogenase gamma chain